MFRKLLDDALELVKMVLICLAIVVPVRYFLIQPFYVKGASMEPTFSDSQYLIVNEIDYRFNNPKRGDVIVFRYPNDPQEFFIKRVIGLPNETIKIENGQVIIINDQNPNGLVLKETYLPEGLTTFNLTNNSLKLYDNQYFVMGDNRNASKDSRSFGPVNKDLIIGKVFFRGWPLNKVTVFKEINYSSQ